MTQAYEQLLRGLRSSSEPSRLRLLAVLSLGEFTVSELTALLGQSQPRVSRHLKLLAEGGLLERFREQHWVYHRLPSDGPGAEFARALLALLDPDDAQLAVDRARATALLAARAAAPDRDLTDGDVGAEIAAAVARELGDEGRDTIAYAGPSPAEMLGSLAPRARRALGVSASRDEVQRARARLHCQGYAHCVLKHGDLRAMHASPAGHGAVVLDRLLAGETRRRDLLEAAARLLAPGGSLVVVEDYEALARAVPAVNPLAALRGWIADAGLACGRLRPLDAGSAHVLVAIATAPGVEQAA
ncbi:MAG: metalloregulator ArsR/SmtB family transcription factor [Steroidobacteraceae bacterium]